MTGSANRSRMDHKLQFPFTYELFFFFGKRRILCNNKTIIQNHYTKLNRSDSANYGPVTFITHNKQTLCQILYLKLIGRVPNESIFVKEQADFGKEQSILDHYWVLRHLVENIFLASLWFPFCDRCGFFFKVSF